MMPRIQRLIALIQKETTQVRRDRRLLFMILGLPMLELFLFAYAVRLTVDHLPTALYDQSRDEQSRAFVQSLSNSGFFNIDSTADSDKAVIQSLDNGQAKVGIIIPPDFADHLERGDASLLILLDGSDSFSLQSGYAAANLITQMYNMDLVTQKIARSGANIDLTLPQETFLRVLYNPDNNDLIFILPGLAALVIQTLAVGTAAVSVVREREAGTLEQILTTPTRPIELMIGKLVPLFFLILLDMLLILGFGVFWFKVPFQGNFWMFMGLATTFILSCLGLGMLISTIASTQKQAQQLSNVLTMFSLTLSGFLYPRDTMPFIPRSIGNLLPLTYFIRLARGVITKGIGLQFLSSDALVLVFYMLLIIFLAAATFRKRLD